VHLLSDLRERSRRPHHSPRLTAARTEQRVIALREQTGWGAKKLHVLLAEEEIPLSVRTIHRILERHKLISEDSHGPALTRFERANRTNFWQMDTKGKISAAVGSAHRCRS